MASLSLCYGKDKLDQYTRSGEPSHRSIPIFGPLGLCTSRQSQKCAGDYIMCNLNCQLGAELSE